jgi:hypothetical protein
VHSLNGKKDGSSSSRSQGKKNNGSISSDLHLWIGLLSLEATVLTSVEEVHFSNV